MWVDEQHYQILGTRFRVRTTSRAIATDVQRLLAPFDYGRRTGVRGRHTYSVVDHGSLVIAYQDCVPIGGGRNAAEALSTMMASINRFAIESCPSFASHAAVVAHSGVAVAIPGESAVGKTTLTTSCLLEGFSYVSDEALVVDVETRRVVPYPKPLSLSDWSLERLGLGPSLHGGVAGEGETFFSATEIADAAAGPLELGHVVLAEYGHPNASLDVVPAADAMTAVLGNSFNHYKHGRAAFELAAELANQVTTWRLRYDDPLEAARLLRRAVTS